jgi:hypothetical protein
LGLGLGGGAVIEMTSDQKFTEEQNQDQKNNLFNSELKHQKTRL